MKRNHNRELSSAKPRTKNKLIIAALIFIALLIIFRLALPRILLTYLNSELQDLQEYTGHIGDIDFKLYKGSYIVRDIVIEKIDENRKADTIPFISSESLDLSVDWGALVKGKVAGKILVNKPVLKYSSEFHKDKEIKYDTSDFRAIIRKMMPMTVNRFEIRDAQIHFIDPNVKPVIDIYMSDLYLTATNLTNLVTTDDLLPAHVTAAASMYDGNFNMDIQLDPLNKKPTFEMSAELKNMDMTALNDFFRAYADFQVNKGRFSMFSEFAGKEGKFGGYVKPFIEDFEIKRDKEDEKIMQRFWEILIGSAMKILKNPDTDNVATKIPVNGEFTDAEINIWKAIHYTLRNAFVQALRPAIENSISVNKLQDETGKTFLEKVFGDNKDERDNKNDAKKEEKNGDN